MISSSDRRKLSFSRLTAPLAHTATRSKIYGDKTLKFTVFHEETSSRLVTLRSTDAKLSMFRSPPKRNHTILFSQRGHNRLLFPHIFYTKNQDGRGAISSPT